MARIPTLVGREEAMEVYFPSLVLGPVWMQRVAVCVCFFIKKVKGVEFGIGSVSL